MDENGSSHEPGQPKHAPALVAALLSALYGVSASRIVYEGAFPQGQWLGRPLSILLVALSMAVLGWLAWRRLAHLMAEHKVDPQSEPSPHLTPLIAWKATVPFWPIVLNLGYLLSRPVDLAQGRFLFFTGLWLSALFLGRLLADEKTWRWLGFVFLAGYLLPVYLLTMGQTVGTADTFEFQVVVPRLGIVHPTGYPLYLLLAKPFTFLPLGTIAWRVNLATAVFGVAAVSLLYLLGWRLTGRSLPALTIATLFGLTPTFWSQAVEAEVYTLHALVVIAALLLMREIGDWKVEANIWGSGIGERGAEERNIEGGLSNKPDAFKWVVLLALTVGLGLANHLTTVILLPAAALTLLFAYRAGRLNRPYSRARSITTVVAAFALPLLLYAYLPIRWSAVNGEAMGLSRFIDWVIGGRFQGALQLTAWLNDPIRYNVVGRLLSAEWPSTWVMIVILVGAAYGFLWQWRYGLILFVTWLGYVFYALNYYVPDLAVFAIPAQVIMAIWLLIGLAAALDLVVATRDRVRAIPLEAIFALAALTPLLAIAAGQTWSSVDRSAGDGRARWGRAVLDLPLAESGAILADSDKFPSLYYLQQAEGLRPDLDIVVLPDEAAYRAEVDVRLTAGQTVYLARFLPGMEGLYHLRSVGPLTEVAPDSLNEIPEDARLSDLTFGPIRLLGYALEPSSPYADGQTTVTFYWQSPEPLADVWHVYTRWSGEAYHSRPSSQHPANNTYPTVAWEPGEVVADFHTLPQPLTTDPGGAALQVALASPFTPVSELKWQTVAAVQSGTVTLRVLSRPLRLYVGEVALDGAAYPDQLRPQGDLTVTLGGYGANPEPLTLTLTSKDGVDKSFDEGSHPNSTATAIPISGPVPADGRSPSHFQWTTQLDTDLPAGAYDLAVATPGSDALCGWLAGRSDGCMLGRVTISGVALPAESTNFDDKIALTNIELPELELQPGSQLAVYLTWLLLSPVEEDYTVFVQVLDAGDRIAGQVDSWPLQGTYPTSQWSPGETIDDPYLVQLDRDLAPGAYKLHVGLYLLETLRRLPVLDETGAAVDDKVVVPGLVIPPVP